MKKKYITPEIAVMEIMMSGMLCISGTLVVDASEDALAPELENALSLGMEDALSIDLQDDALVIDIDD